MKRPHGFDSGKSNTPSTRQPVSPPAPPPAPLPLRPRRERSEGPEAIQQSTEVPTADEPIIEAEKRRPDGESGDAAEPAPETSLETQGLSAQSELAATSQRAKEALKTLKAAQRERRMRERGERRRFVRFSRTRKRRLLIVLGSVLALALFVAIGVLSPALNLQKITVVGTERLDPNAVVESLSGQLGTPLALLNEQSIHSSLTAFSLIQEYTLETRPPHELIVRIVERQPVLNLKRGETFDLVDPAGVVIESSPERVAGYPLGEGLVVDVNSPAFQATARSLAYMQADLAAQVDTATATTDQDVTFRLGSGLIVIWGSAEESTKKSVLVTKMMASLGGQSVSVLNVSSTEAPVFS